MKKFLLFAVLSLSACQPEVGPAGPPGPAGPQGPKGDTGPAGSDGVGLVSNVHCTSSETIINGITVGLYYDEYTFADGSVLASCALTDRYAVYSGMELYKREMSGALTGSCFITYEMDTGVGSNGYWGLEHPSGSPTKVSAQYSDPGSQYNGRVISLTCTRF